MLRRRYSQNEHQKEMKCEKVNSDRSGGRRSDGRRYRRMAGQFHGSGIVDDIKVQAAEEFKKAFVHEVGEFFKSDDLEKSLGIDHDGQAAIEASIKDYIRNYSMDEEKLSEVKASLETLLESADGLSTEELQDRISGIFGE